MPHDSYKLVPTKSFLRNLRAVRSRVSENLAEKIDDTIEALADNPFQGKKLKGFDFGVWRIRIGDYRLRYDIDGKNVILQIIRHRKDVYK